MDEYKALIRTAARAYERNRLVQSLLDSLPAFLLAGAILLINFRLLNIVIAALVIISSVSFRWIGKRLGKSVGPAVFLGWVPLMLPLIPMWFEDGCCSVDRCTTLCSYACGASGVIVGFWLARIHMKTGNGLASWLVSGGVVTASSVAGCACVGASTTVAFVVALLASAGVSALVRPGRQQNV